MFYNGHFTKLNKPGGPLKNFDWSLGHLAQRPLKVLIENAVYGRTTVKKKLKQYLLKPSYIHKYHRQPQFNTRIAIGAWVSYVCTTDMCGNLMASVSRSILLKEPIEQLSAPIMLLNVKRFCYYLENM